MKNGSIRIAAAAVGLSMACSGEPTAPSLESRVLFPATTDCSFSVTGTKMTLRSDCVTDEAILVPDGYTLDGAGHSITAVDPPGGHFRGGVVRNAGATAHVRRLEVTTAALSGDVCHSFFPDRLAGIAFNGASGTIEHVEVLGITQGPGPGCEFDGVGIELRRLPFAAVPVDVEVAHVRVEGHRVTGISVLGSVRANLHHIVVGAASQDDEVDVNAVFIARAVPGTILSRSRLEGHQYRGPGARSSKTVRIRSQATGITVERVHFTGNADIGVSLEDGSTGNEVRNNLVFDEGPDGPNGDIGIADLVGGNVVVNNKIRGFDTPLLGVVGGGNVVIP